jgi:hypothetical protein
MKIAILCEGAPGGEDQQVFEQLARRIQPEALLRMIPLGSKPNLMSRAGDVVQALIADGYDRIVILWDILPRWGRPDGEELDAEELMANLRSSGVEEFPCLFLVAIHKELEAWLLADGGALSAVLSRPAHPVRVTDTRNADHNANPKKRLELVFKQHGRTYTPKSHAGAIVKALPRNFGALGGLASFKKFGRALTVPC